MPKLPLVPKYRVNDRERFILKMIFLCLFMLVVLITINTDLYSNLIILALFAYIIGMEFFDYFREVAKPDVDAKLRQQIGRKLDNVIDQIKRIV